MSEIADVPEPIDRPSETNWDDELVFDRPTPAPAQPPADRADPTAPDPAEPVNPTNSIDDLNDPTADPAPPAAVAEPDQPIAPSEPLPTPEPAPEAEAAEPIATDVTSEIAPEINSEIAPEINPEINSEIHSEITADVAPELTPDATSAASVARLSDRVAALTAERDRLTDEIAQARADMGRLLSLGTVELEQRRKTLLASIEQLERRQERIRQEMKGTFAGASQNVAARVQGFKDYLVGSLQELVAAAEELSLAPPPPPAPAPTADRPNPATATPPVSAADNRPQGDRRKVEQLLERYRTRPDYYGPPWRLRRTFEQVHADRVAQWFFDLGGRGALRTMGSRLQNILVVSAAISVLRAIHGDRLRTLILIDSPERLGDWRRGLQDSLGISRADFGAEQGIMLFESPDPLAQRADRIQRNGGVPFIIVDESDGRISLSLLQFPLWLAIAPDPRIAPPPNTSTYDY
ncbi:MAG TPA: DUF3086 domain-containing protein [Coleofasciculaceae cyanobacterium]